MDNSLETEVNIEAPKLATFEQLAEEWLEKEKSNSSLDKSEFADYASGVKYFAEYIDKIQTLDNRMQMLALQKTLETYIEFYGIMKERVTPEVLQGCLTELKNRHPQR